jgi:hypothetical protein
VLQPDYVLVGMDTLAATPGDKSPHNYCSKIMTLPHLAAVMCPTGILELGLDWYVNIQANVLARDIDYVNEIAPDRLREISAGLPGFTTSTIYHFGFSPRANSLVGTAFRSANSFSPEVLEYGLGIKPAFEEVLAVATDDLDELGYSDGIVKLLHRLRVADDARPVEERVGIGGQVHLLTLTPSRQVICVADQWPDFDEQFDSMLEALQTVDAEARSNDA